jgi:hypothetical protein
MSYIINLVFTLFNDLPRTCTSENKVDLTSLRLMSNLIFFTPRAVFVGFDAAAAGKNLRRHKEPQIEQFTVLFGVYIYVILSIPQWSSIVLFTMSFKVVVHYKISILRDIACSLE